MTTRRRVLKSMAAAPLVLPLAPHAASAGTARVLRYAFEIAETGFDPAQLLDRYSRIVTGHIFDGLYRYDHLARPFKVKPNVAAAMPEVSSDYRTWTIPIRPGIYFQDDPAFDGRRRELVAQDFVYSFKRLADPRWKAPAWASVAEFGMLGLAGLRDTAMKQRSAFDYDREIEGLRALDRYTLQLKVSGARPRLLQNLTGGSILGAVAREVVEKYGDQIMGHPVGTGAFELAEWRRSSKIVLVRNPDYRVVTYDGEPNADDVEGQALAARFAGRKLPMIDRVEISIIEETQPRWLSFINRQHDLLELLPFEFANIAIPNNKLAPNLQKRGIRMYRTLASDVTMTYFNMEDPIVGGYQPAQVALRRAISLGVNVDQEIRLYWRGQAMPAQSALMPHTVGYDRAFRGENGEYSPARAKALLDMFGYVDRDGDGWRERPDGSPLKLVCASVPDQRTRQRDELRRKDLNALGIKVDFAPAKWPENLKNARAGKLMMWNLGLTATAPDGQPSLDTGASIHKGGQNLARFSDKRFDALYNRMREIPDGPEREALFEQGKRLVTAYAPYKYHVHRILTDLAQPWLVGYRRGAFWTVWWSYVDIDPEASDVT